MIVKTKRIALDPKEYVSISFKRHMKAEWKWLLIPAAIFLLGLVLHFSGAYKNWWIPVVSVVGGGLYVLFWYAQFYAASQMEQNKQMFEKFIYEIDSRQILVKINQKEGGIMKWESIQSAERMADAFLLIIGKGQFLRFPISGFNSEHDLKLFESILKRKDLL